MSKTLLLDLSHKKTNAHIFEGDEYFKLRLKPTNLNYLASQLDYAFKSIDPSTVLVMVDNMETDRSRFQRVVDSIKRPLNQNRVVHWFSV